MNNLKDLPEQQRPNPGYGSGQHTPLKYKSAELVTERGTFNQQLSNITDTSSAVLNSNPRRNYLLIQNNGANDVFINFGNKAEINNIKIAATGNYEPNIIPIDSINLINSAGNESLCAIVEGTEVI